jgi:precorrin-4/cobalt-precorrin-4 C11-methyltransferase
MKVYFVGAGPGAPDLITLRGRRLLEEADIVIYAGSLVSPEHLAWCRTDVQRMDSAGMNLDEVTRVYSENREKSGIIVRLHTGDPSVYGAIQEQMDFLDSRDIPFEVVPGVSSFQAASAVLKRQFTLPGVSQTVILSRIEGRTAVPESQKLEVLAESRATLVLFLSVDRAEEVQRRLEPFYGKDTPVAVVYKASWKDQKVFTGRLDGLSALVKEHDIRRHALIVIGNVLASDYEKSKLYDAAFTHGYRRGEQPRGTEKRSEV